MKRLYLLSTLLVVLALPLDSALRAQSMQLVTFETDELSIETAAGESHAFQVEIAKTAEQRAQGLMYRREMAADAGMLFLFGRSQERAMWMKNTLIPLDMLFIDTSGRIVHIEQRTVPHSLRAIRSGGPVSAVLELNAGTAARLSIGPGDRIIHAAFQ